MIIQKSYSGANVESEKKHTFHADMESLKAMTEIDICGNPVKWAKGLRLARKVRGLKSTYQPGPKFIANFRADAPP